LLFRENNTQYMAIWLYGYIAGILGNWNNGKMEWRRIGIMEK